MSLINILKPLIQKPAKLFLIDAFGALVTASSLSLVLTHFESYFGMPRATLYLLAAIALGFFIYSFSVSRWVKSGFRRFLLPLLWLNMSYCVVSVFFMVRHFEVLTVLGITYFALEIVIVSFLVFVEWRVYKALSSKN